MITIDVDTTAPFTLAGELERQIPFAVSLGINNAIKGAQLAIRRKVLGTFVIRREKYITESIKITKFADKRHLEGVLEVDPTRDVLAKFEPGGVKESRTGGSVVVPVEVRPVPQAVVPKAMRPRAFKFTYRGRGPKATVFIGEQRTFLVKRAGGMGALFQRVGPPGPRGRPRKGESRPGSGRARLRLLYILTPKTRIPASLHFRQVGYDLIHKTWPDAYRKALIRALQTAR